MAVTAAWPYPPGRRGTGRVRERPREIGRHRPKRLKGEQGRQLRHQLAARDGARCLYCSRPDDPDALTLDHFVPFSWARRHRWRFVHEPWNLVLACRRCNEAKADVLPWPLVWLVLAHAGGERAEHLAAAA